MLSLFFFLSHEDNFTWWWCDRLLKGRSSKTRSSTSMSGSMMYLGAFSTTKLMPPWSPCSRFRRWWWWWWWWWCRCCRELARELGPETTPLGCISGLKEEWWWWCRLWLALLCRPLTCLGVAILLLETLVSWHPKDALKSPGGAAKHLESRRAKWRVNGCSGA